jgi:hypothetical protein
MLSRALSNMVRASLVGATVLVVWSSSASASVVTLFSDGFSSSDANWSLNTSSPTVADYLNLGGSHGYVLHFEYGDSSNPDGTATSVGSAINATGYTNLTLQFDYWAINLNSGDSLTAQWDVAGSGVWNNLSPAITSNTSGFTTVSYNFTTTGTDIDIRFAANLSSCVLNYSSCWDFDPDEFKIDNVLLTDPLPTPLPGALALFGSVLFGGLGISSLRKRRDRCSTSVIA